MKKLVCFALATVLLLALCFALSSCGECKEHEWDYANGTTVAPTCTENGKYVYKCKNCDATKDIAADPEMPEDAALLATGHTKDAATEEVTTAATCTTAGVKSFDCATCGAEGVITEEIRATGHKFARVLSTADGKHFYACTVEGCDARDQEEDCEYEVVEKDADKHYELCSVCEKPKADSEVAHNFGEPVTTPATCTKEGSETKTCADCGYEVVTPLAIVPHTYDETKWGGDDTQHWIPCTVCGQAKDGTQGNHNFGSEITVYPVAGFCKPGEIYQECADCGRKVISTYIPSDAPHTFVFDAAKSELQEGGVQAGTLVYSCSACDFSYSIDAIGLKNFDDKTRAGNVWGVPTSDKASLTYENGNITVVGPIDSKASLGNTPNFDINNNPQNEGIVFANGKSVVLGFDFGAPTGGFPEANFHTSTKLSNNWGMSGLIVNGDGTMTYNGQPIGTADHTKMTSFVVKFVLDPSTLMVNFTVWIDGVKVLTDATPYPGNASASASFQDATTYMNITITPNAANVALDRGLIIDNIFYANEVPEYLSAQ